VPDGNALRINLPSRAFSGPGGKERLSSTSTIAGAGAIRAAYSP
jgi:hypothetical protein